MRLTGSRSNLYDPPCEDHTSTTGIYLLNGACGRLLSTKEA